MHELTLRLECRNAKAAKASIEPDISNNENMKTKLSVEGDFLIIKVKGKKMSHIKAVMNAYLGLVGLLNEVDDSG